MKERIKAIRKAAGMNQKEFAEMLGISKSSVESYEQGLRVPTAAAISLICEKFQVRREWLETGNGEMKIPAPDLDAETEFIEMLISKTDSPMCDLIRDIMAIYIEQPPEARKAIENFVNALYARIESKKK